MILFLSYEVERPFFSFYSHENKHKNNIRKVSLRHKTKTINKLLQMKTL